MRKAFTLIELIFVIVIIGLLAAVAVPKFLNLKQHAEANSVVKTTIDTAQQAVEAAINQLDLEDKTDVNLGDLVSLKGKGWKCEDNVDTDNNSSTTETMDQCYYTDVKSGNKVAEINFSTNPREVNYSINCNNFEDKNTQNACAKELNSSSVSITLTY